MVSIVHNGNKVTELQSLGLSIFNVCDRHGISLEIKWIPRSFNNEADLCVEPLILTITPYMTMCSTCLILNGNPTQWIGLPAAIKSRFRVITNGFNSLARKL